jgi:hypothetical protein
VGRGGQGEGEEKPRPMGTGAGGLLASTCSLAWHDTVAIKKQGKGTALELEWLAN